MSSSGRALVTGASRGIGRAVAEALAAEGWDVLGTCRSPRRLPAAERVPGVTYLPLDLKSERGIEAFVRAAGDVDLLVNNAGESPVGPAEEIPIRKIREHFQVNFFGPARLVQALLPGMRARRRGMVVFIGSIRGEAPTPFSSIYSASKAAQKSFGECLRLELLGTGVRVAVVAPWYVRTGAQQELVMRKKSPYAEAVESVRRTRDRMISNGQDPRVVARAVLRLAKSRNPAPFTVIGKPLLTFLIRHAPRRLLARGMARVTGMRPVSC
ncbi:MAG TPA: SDR family oxidoreductase [Spirochaetia bacterium]|nr:SDR family oxidoreductase [Spirochaetia bacterium]